MPYSICHVVRTILLRFALVHTPTIVRCCCQPARLGMTQCHSFKCQRMGLPCVVRRIAVLKQQCGVVIVVSRSRSTFRDNCRSTQTMLVITRTHGGVFWRSKARLIDAFLPICLEKGMEFSVHRSPAQNKERAVKTYKKLQQKTYLRLRVRPFLMFDMLTVRDLATFNTSS